MVHDHLLSQINSRTPLIEPSPPNVTLISKLNSGNLTAHKTISLVLLPSRSDTVRSVLLRETKISSLPPKDCFTGVDLSQEFHLARAGCKLQGTATSPSSTAKTIIAKYRKLGQRQAFRYRGNKKAEVITLARNRKMAEREGFEPSTPVTQCTRFPGGRLRPLSHLSECSLKLINIYLVLKNLVNKRDYIAKRDSRQCLITCKNMYYQKFLN